LKTRKLILNFFNRVAQDPDVRSSTVIAYIRDKFRFICENIRKLLLLIKFRVFLSKWNSPINVFKKLECRFRSHS